MSGLAKLLEATATPLSFQPGLAGAGGKRSTVDIPHQEQDWWCWCAITAGVAAHYQPAFNLSQCQTAGRILDQPSACADPSGDAVNRMFVLDKALATFGNLQGPEIAGPISFQKIKSEIDADRPVGVRMLFLDSGLGHFTVICGYRDGDHPMLSIDDPLYDESDVAYQNFVSRYRGWGRWTHTYLTSR